MYRSILNVAHNIPQRLTMDRLLLLTQTVKHPASHHERQRNQPGHTLVRQAHGVQISRVGYKPQHPFDTQGRQGVERYFISRVRPFVLGSAGAVFEADTFVVAQKGFEGFVVVEEFGVADSFRACGATDGGWRGRFIFGHGCEIEVKAC